MKAYLLTSGTIFSLFAVSHVFITYEQWRRDAPDAWGPALIAVCGAALAIWAFRLTRNTTGASS